MLTLSLISIGILAVLLTLAAWFTPLTDTRVETSISEPTALNSPEFYTALKAITGSPVYPLDQKVTVLDNGDEFLPDILGEINNAEHSITLTNYIWEKGELAGAILDAVTKKAKEGVKIRIMMDAKGSLKAPQDKIEALEEAGGKVESFRPFGFRTLTRLNKRTHLRALVIDGKVGYIGGIAFNDEWLGDGTEPKTWRDEMFKFRGYGAQAIQDMFNNLWRQTDGEILAGEDFYPNLHPIAIGDNSADTSRFVPLFHSPTPDLEKNLAQMIWLSISAAEKRIYLETPYLLPEKNILKVLKEKAAAGVDVEIVVPGPYVDSKIVQLASRSYYKEIIDAGIKLYEYQPAHLHTKTLVVDGAWSVIGSANLDNRSSTLNVEGVIGVADETLARDLEQVFEHDRERSAEVTAGTLHIDILDKLFGHLSRLFAKQY